MAVAQTFLAFVDREQAERAHRANLRAFEQQTGEPHDDTGRYWLERTAVLEHIAEQARALSRQEPGLCAGLAELIRQLDAVKAPVCRPGDHE